MGAKKGKIMKRKIIIPFHRGQKVRVDLGNGRVETGYIDKASHGPAYAIIYEKNGEYAGGEAWIDHSFVTLLKEVDESAIIFLEKAYERMSEDGDL